MTHQTKTPKRKKIQSNSSTFSDHFTELRSRIFIVFLIFILGSAAGYFFHQDILDFLIKPLGQPIFYTSPSGGFEFVFQISLFFGLLVSIPVFVYQTIRFIEPILPKKYPNMIVVVLLSSIVLMSLGIAFAYMVSLPAALYFLNKFTTDQIQSLISTKEYFTFVTRYLIGFGLIFQLPLVMLAVNAIKPISIKTLLGFERWVILISFVVAAIITPTPDIFNQLVMAIPIVLLYQISVLMVWWINRNKSSKTSN